MGFVPLCDIYKLVKWILKQREGYSEKPALRGDTCSEMCHVHRHVCDNRAFIQYRVVVVLPALQNRQLNGEGGEVRERGRTVDLALRRAACKTFVSP